MVLWNNLFQQNKTLSKAHYLHLFPFVLFISLLAVIPANGEFETFWNYGLVAFHLGIYLILSWLVLIRNDSNASTKKNNWYRNILIGVTLVWVYYLGHLLNLKLHYIWGPVFYSFLIYAFSYLFLNRSNFEIEKYGSSGLNKNNSLTLFNKIQRLFKNENLFLEPAITIKTVSEKLSENPREISQAINENARQNFNEFVNHYRISKAKALMDDSRNRDKKVATIAYDSGFGTVTAFNVAFKKSTGLTPSAYRRKNILN